MESNSNILIDDLFNNWENDSRVFIRLLDGKEISRKKFIRLSSEIANRLVGLGVKPGERVAVQVEKSFEALALYVACIRVGAIFLPLNTSYTSSDIEYFLSDANPRLFVFDSSLMESSGSVCEKANIKFSILDADGTGDLLQNRGNKGCDSFVNVARNTDDPATILYTSGTTGRSKGALLSHGNLLSNAMTLQKLWQFTEKDVLLHILPIFHVHGLFTAFNTASVAGSTILLLPKFDAKEVCRRLPESTVMMGVPTHYTRLLAEKGFNKKPVEGMRLFISGSAPLLIKSHEEFEERTGHKILERYGMSETGMNSSNPYIGERRKGTVGFPLTNISIRITDEDTGNELPNDTIGMINVKGENVFSGYWNNPEKTAESFTDDGYFITGDLGKFDPDGYLHIIGRNKDMIISGGLNVYPKEVEIEINSIPGVLESAVVGAPHSDFGECGVAAVVIRKGEELSPEKIRAKLTKNLAKFKIPKKILLVDKLPTNTMGKVQKNILRDQYSAVFQ